MQNFLSNNRVRCAGIAMLIVCVVVGTTAAYKHFSNSSKSSVSAVKTGTSMGRSMLMDELDGAEKGNPALKSFETFFAQDKYGADLCFVTCNYSDKVRSIKTDIKGNTITIKIKYNNVIEDKDNSLDAEADSMYHGFIPYLAKLADKADIDDGVLIVRVENGDGSTMLDKSYKIKRE
jgi:hypothetical protein